IDATVESDNGAVFTVVVSNSTGTRTSNTATLTVQTADQEAPAGTPVISTQPLTQSVVAPGTASFSVTATATGTGPLRYQWKKNGSNIDGATSSTYTTPATSNADNGAAYSVSISNSAGTVTSNTATLTVAPALGSPAIGSQPVAQSVVTATTASFSVTATGTEPLAYQWKKNGTDIAGATSSTYTTPVTSSPATLTVTALPVPPGISTQPVAQSVFATDTASFSVVATGTDPLAYQWKKNGTDIAGATSRTYTTPATVLTDNNAVFTVVVSNSAGTVTSNPATLAVTALRITTQPSAQTVDLGGTASFSVTAVGAGTLTYQWKKDGTDIVGATSSTYSLPVTVIADNNAVFSVVVSNSAFTVTSSNAKLKVNPYSLVANASGGFYDKTECVKDNSTGLFWEGKTASGSRAGTNTYTNFDGTGTDQKGDGSNATQAEIDASTNSIGYVNAVNTAALCGFTDWRRPTYGELYGIADTSQRPSIDNAWFPYTQSRSYWSSSPWDGFPHLVFLVSFVGDPQGYQLRSHNKVHIRLVR
ncbi:MAG: DUF1566 domain-containing protein, partial [Rhodoferax sp.]|nr:DUF1566 domain-containing protein [Rhodoferax sp.]